MSSRFLRMALISICALAYFYPAEANAQIGRRFGNRANGPVVARGRNSVGRIMQRRQARLLRAEEAAAQTAAGSFAAGSFATGSSATGSSATGSSATGSSAIGSFAIGPTATSRKEKSPTAASSAQGPQLAAKPNAVRQASANLAIAPVRPLPTTAQLAAMDEVALFDAWREMTEILHEQLSTLTTAASWQRYLVATDDLRGEQGTLPSEINVDELQKLLARFDKVSNNSEYTKINSRSSFATNRAALREIITRFAGPKLGGPVGGEIAERQPEAKPEGREEILPTPFLASERPEASPSERSILKRASK